MTQGNPWVTRRLECRKISALAEAAWRHCFFHLWDGLWVSAKFVATGTIPNCPYFNFFMESLEGAD